MSVGIIDQDALVNRKDFFYDLDVMKIASYYKNTKREITKLLLVPSEYTQYRNVFYIKNKYNYKNFAPAFSDPRIQYRGYAFYTGEYDPLSPEIEAAIPDPTIYDTYLKYNDQITGAGSFLPGNEAFINGLHARLSTDGLTCNVADNIIRYNTSAQYLTFYDYNVFALENWRERLLDFKDLTHIKLKFMPNTNDLQDILYLKKNVNLKRNEHMIYSGELNKEILNEILVFGKQHGDAIRVELFQNINVYLPNYIDNLIVAIDRILLMKHNKARVHVYVDPKKITSENVFMNDYQRWSNMNHGDISLMDYLVNVRNRQPCIRKTRALSEDNEVFNYLVNVKPSQWRSVIK